LVRSWFVRWLPVRLFVGVLGMLISFIIAIWTACVGQLCSCTRSFSNAEPHVHRGFHRSWETVKREVLGKVESLVQECRNDDNSFKLPVKIIVCGHSLGGAIATLAACDIASQQPDVNQLSCYVFGCPRVGDQHFVDMYNKKVRASVFQFVSPCNLLARLVHAAASCCKSV
jgi:Lipase (class 3)